MVVQARLAPETETELECSMSDSQVVNAAKSEALELLYADAAGIGICIECWAIHYGGVEPDAANYRCEVCGLLGVWGLEEALIAGFLD